MKKIKDFFTTSLLGGLIVILPIALLYIVFKWFFNKITDIIQPLTNLVISKSSIHYEILADVLVLVVIFIIFFLVGVFVKTKLGTWAYRGVETKILKAAPGYSLIKETVLQLIGKKKSFFSSVVLVQIFQNDILATGFVTDEHADGSYTVFVPTGPNPTTGFIYHMPAKYVHLTPTSVEAAMRSIISCGAGSAALIEATKIARNV